MDETGRGLNFNSITFSNIITKNLNTHLDFESSFESAGKEASEGANQRCKCWQSNAVDLERVQVHSLLRRKTRGRGGALQLDLSTPPKLKIWPNHKSKHVTFLLISGSREKNTLQALLIHLLLAALSCPLHATDSAWHTKTLQPTGYFLVHLESSTTLEQ